MPATPSAAVQLDLDISPWGQFCDSDLEREYAASLRPRGVLAIQRLSMGGVAIMAAFMSIHGPFLPVFVCIMLFQLSSLALSYHRRTKAVFERYIHGIAVSYSMSIVVLLVLIQVVIMLSPSLAPEEGCCTAAMLTFVVLITFLTTFAVSIVPTITFANAFFMTLPLLPLTLAISIGSVNLTQDVLLGAYMAIFLMFHLFLREMHTNARRSWFLIRRLRADNVLVRLNRQSVFSAFASKAGGSNKVSRVSTIRAQPWIIDPESLIRTTTSRGGSSLGVGAFGQVFRAQWRGTTVAVKELLASDSADIHAQQEFQDEIALLFSLRHPNVVLFMGVAVDQDRLLLVTEYVSGGSLSVVLANSRVPLSSKLKTSWIAETARGMQYLHGNEPPILHRDLKPENLLVDGAHVKIADFGLSGREQGGPARGTPLYMPPESLSGEPMTKAGDVFAYGIVVNQIWSRAFPYDQQERLEHVLYRVVVDAYRPQIDPNMPTWLQTLVQRCWAAEARHRPTFTEISDTLVDSDLGMTTLEGDAFSVSETSEGVGAPIGGSIVAHVAVDLVLMLDLWQRNPADAVHMCDAFGDAVSKAMVATEGFPARSEGGAHLVLFRDPPKAAVFVDRLRGEVAADTRLELVQQELRAGVHLGEALMDGETYFGPTVQRTVELCELCDGLEVRVSDDYFDEYGWSAPTVPDSDDGECRSADLVGRPRAEKVQRRTSHLSSLGRKAFPWMLQLEEIGNLCSLGTGPMAEVFSGQLPDGTAVAVKQLFVRRMSERARLGFLGQVGTLVALRHPNIAAVVGAVIPPPQRFCIVSQLLGPSLREALDTGSVPVRASRVRRDVGRGLAFLHRHGVAHGHLTSNNVVVSKEDGRVAVCDFGFQETRVETATMTKAIRFWWTAPEVLLGRAESTLAAAAAADVYSLGIVVWEAGTGRRPFDHVDEAKIGAIGAMAQIGEGERPEVLEEDLLDGELEFVRAAWSSDVGERPKLEEE